MIVLEKVSLINKNTRPLNERKKILPKIRLSTIFCRNIFAITSIEIIVQIIIPIESISDKKKAIVPIKNNEGRYSFRTLFRFNVFII